MPIMAHLSSAATMAMLFALFLANADLSACSLFKGSASCLDCAPHHDLSGVVVAVKCGHLSRYLTASTNKKGYFEVDIPSNFSKSSSASPDCLAAILGGPQQLCSKAKSMVSKVVKAPGSNFYSLSTPLTYSFSSCPSKLGNLRSGIMSRDEKKAAAAPRLPASPTSVRPRPAPPALGSPPSPLPFPWDLLPSPDFYFRIIPIIGIP